MAEGKIKIKLVRSPICTPQKHKNIVRSLGLHTVNRVVERPDTRGFRGMVAKVPHLLEIVTEPSASASGHSFETEPRALASGPRRRNNR
jgi:large subunit ribosomal protein L30